MNARANAGHELQGEGLTREPVVETGLEGMGDFLSYVVWILAIAVILFAIGYGFKAYFGGIPPITKMLTPREARRLDIVEQSNLDGRRRLFLIRRDDVEHLIMTGGPVDVVVETGIGAKQPVALPRQRVTEPAQSRPAKSFGSAVGEN